MNKNYLNLILLLMVNSAPMFLFSAMNSVDLHDTDQRSALCLQHQEILNQLSTNVILAAASPQAILEMARIYSLRGDAQKLSNLFRYCRYFLSEHKINFVQFLNTKDEHGYSLLAYASSGETEGHHECVEVLVEAGVCDEVQKDAVHQSVARALFIGAGAQSLCDDCDDDGNWADFETDIDKRDSDDEVGEGDEGDESN